MADLAPRTAADHHRADPIASAITVRRLAILPGTAEAEGDLVLDLTSVALVKAVTGIDPAQAAIPDTAGVDGLRGATAHHLDSIKVVTTGTETTVRDARKVDREKSAKEDQARGAPNEQMDAHHVTSVNKEIVAPARFKGTVKIALREALLAA